MNKEFWVELESLSALRINELIEDLSLKNIPGIRVRWTQSLLEINKQWNELAKQQIDACAKYDTKVAHKVALKLATFRGNDE